MIRLLGKVVLLLVVLSLFSSCAYFPKGIFSPGELKLLDLNIPGTMVEDLPYDVVVTFRSNGDAKITKACFRWLDETSLVNETSLYCYAAAASSNEGLSTCRRWLADGQYSSASPVFCSDVKDVVYEDPGRFTVRLASHNVKKNYNTLESYVEYLANGNLKNSNRVAKKIPVEE